MNKKIISLGLAVWATAVWADPSVSVTRVAPRFPWNGIVDIDYTIAGLPGDSTDYLVELSLDGAVLSNFVDYASCDLPLANGANRVAWDASRDGYAREVSGAAVKAKLIRRILTVTDARYLIVDLSGGATAASYPVRLASECDAAEFDKDIYKTDRLVLKRVNKGGFWMGEGGYDSTGRKAAEWNGDVTYPGKDGSRHRVRLTQDFYLGLFEVTQGQYLNVIGSNPASSKGEVRGTDLRRPVESVNYPTVEGADGILARLSDRALARATKVGVFTLPTEAQWEYAARAGTTTMFPFGNYAETRVNMYLNTVVNFCCDTYVNAKGETNKMTNVVGTRLPNPWGFYDMFGNVAEWIRDWYVTPYTMVGSDGLEHDGTEEDPVPDPFVGETTEYKRCKRGGNFYESTDQYSFHSGVRHYDTGWSERLGFRVAITLK